MSAPHFEIHADSVNTSNVNLGGELHGDERKLRVDVDMKTQVPAETLAKLAIVKKDAPDYQHMLFSDDGKPKATGQKGIDFEPEFEDHILSVHLTGDRAHAYGVKRLKKFKAKPAANGLVDLSFQAQIYPDNQECLWELAGLLKYDNEISISKPAQKDIEEEADSNIAAFPQ